MFSCTNICFLVQVTHPLGGKNMIHSRLNAVSEIAESMSPYKASQDINIAGSDFTIMRPKLHHVFSSFFTFLGRSPNI